MFKGNKDNKDRLMSLIESARKNDNSNEIDVYNACVKFLTGAKAELTEEQVNDIKKGRQQAKVSKDQTRSQRDGVLNSVVSEKLKVTVKENNAATSNKQEKVVARKSTRPGFIDQAKQGLQTQQNEKNENDKSDNSRPRTWSG